MKDYKENIFHFIITFGAILSSILVLLVLFNILKESVPFLKEIRFTEFLFGDSWTPLSKNNRYSFLPMILATLYISFLAIAIVTPLGVGCALFLSFHIKRKHSMIILSFIDMIAGGILLSIMLFPYVVTGCTETFEKGKEKYYAASQSLGVSKWYTMRRIMLPFAANSIFVNMLLAFSRTNINNYCIDYTINCTQDK